MAKQLSDFEWVALARSKDPVRKVLTGVHQVDGADGRYEATDGHRLHVVAASLTGYPTRVIDPATHQPIDGEFPNVGQFIPARNPSFAVRDLPDVLCALEAACAYEKAAKRLRPVQANGHIVSIGKSHVRPRYLLDALTSVPALATQVFLTVDPDPLRPVRIDIDNRIAVIMTFRWPDATKETIFRLDDHLGAY